MTNNIQKHWKYLIYLAISKGDSFSYMDADNTKSTMGFSLLKLALFLSIVIIVSGVVLYSFLDINPLDVLSDGVTGLYNRIFNVSTDEIDALKETVRTVLTFDESENVYCSTVSNNLVVASISYVKIIDPDGIEKAYIPVTLKSLLFSPILMIP